MSEHLDFGSLVVIVITFVLFVVALFVKGLVQDMLLEAVESLPFYLTTEQREAISNLSSKRDLKVISMMFESVGDKKLKTFEPANATVSATGEKMKHEINYSGTRRRFS